MSSGKDKILSRTFDVYNNIRRILMRTLIDLTINEAVLEKTVQRAKEQNIIVPTIAQMKNPDLIPQEIKDKLKTVNTQDLDPINLFRISWYNEPKEVAYTMPTSFLTMLKSHLKFLALKQRFLQCQVSFSLSELTKLDLLMHV
jgi:hypothetical protein